MKKVVLNLQAFVCAPMELVKTQMQVRPECNKVSDTIKSIVDKSGIKGMTRGLGVTVCREVPAFGLYFSSYEVLVNAKKDNTAWVFAAGGFSGIISWVFTYPIDVVKSKLQADTFGATTKYSGNAMQCLKATVATEGMATMFRGMGSTVIRAFPVNAATMGVVTLIMRSFTKEDLTVYDSFKRTRMGQGFYVDLPPSVDKYSKKGLRTRDFYYQNNVSTLSTDGPSIILIAKPEIALSKSKLYVEHMLYSTPGEFQDDDVRLHFLSILEYVPYMYFALMFFQSATVGTIRSDVTLSTVIRVLERILVKDKSKEEHDCEKSCENDLLWNKEKAFTNQTSDFMIDSCSGKPMTVIASTTKEEVTEDTILEPSLLRSHPSRKEQLTTADFLQPTSLVTSNDENKIYGFYYLV